MVFFGVRLRADSPGHVASCRRVRCVERAGSHTVKCSSYIITVNILITHAYYALCDGYSLEIRRALLLSSHRIAFYATIIPCRVSNGWCCNRNG